MYALVLVVYKLQQIEIHRIIFFGIVVSGSSELGNDGNALHWQVSLASCPTLILVPREGGMGFSAACATTHTPSVVSLI